MKEEQLLEAIGGVSEDMLMESEQTVRRTGSTVRRVILVAAVVAALAITAAATGGLFSRPIGETGIITDETVAPFEMDSEGNIIMGGVIGQKVTMQVQIDPDPPRYLEEIYHLDLPDTWQTWGGAGGGGLYTHSFWQTDWRMEGKSGELRLHQSVVSNYLVDNVVDMLQGLPEGTELTTQKTTMAGLEVLKVTIPELPGFEKDWQFCPEGETRLYWSDGRYLLQLDYPRWVTDSEAEELLQTLYTQEFILALPEDYGKVNTQRLLQLNPPLSIDKDITGTTMANSTMGLGSFAYSDGSIYYGSGSCIYRYDLDTGKIEELLLPRAFDSAYHLFDTEYYICYADMRDSLLAMPKDGGEPEIIYQGLGTTDLYADGPMLYTTNAHTYLSRIDLLSGKEEVLVEAVNSYHVDDTYIYVVQTTDSGKHFLRSRKDSVDFEKIELSFRPIKVYADGEDLYFCESRSWQVIRYRDGKETRLPIYAYDYQIQGDKLIYVDEKDEWVVKSYDLQTGETVVLQERASGFSILEDRYICFNCVDEENHPCWKILDLQTGEYSERMPG